MTFTIQSSAFADGQAIPSRHSCEGDNVSPLLSWSGQPEGTQSFALIVDDADAPSPWKFFTHWVMFNIPANVEGLPEAVPARERLENGAIQGVTGIGKMGYYGPCPLPGNPHRYRFTLYALDTTLNLRPRATKEQVLNAMSGHVIGETLLTGTYKLRLRAYGKVLWKQFFG